MAQLGLAAEARPPVASSRPPRSTHTGAGAADHHLVDRRVAQQRLERPEPERALGDPRRELRARARVEHARLAVDQRADAVLRIRGIGAHLAQEPCAQLVGEQIEGAGAVCGVHAEG